MSNKMNFSNQSGMTMLEIIVALSISIVIVWQGKALVTMSDKMQQSIESKFNYLTLMSVIKFELNRKNFKTATASQNPSLSSCRDRVGNCTRLGLGYRPIPISLYKKRGSNYTKMSGIVGSPQYYNGKGKAVNSAAKAIFAITSEALPICENSCNLTEPPEGISYKITIKEVNPTGLWQVRKVMRSFESLNVRTEGEIDGVTCGSRAGYNLFSQKIEYGVVKCTFEENPRTIDSSYTGETGDAGPGTQGEEGPQGSSSCSWCTPFDASGVRHCDSRGGFSTPAGASSFCAAQ